MNLTTEELLEWVIRQIEKMSPEEKRLLREYMNNCNRCAGCDERLTGEFFILRDGRSVCSVCANKLCRRPDGSFRAWFRSPQEALAFQKTHEQYFPDRVVFCQRCCHFHLTNPNWLDADERPWEIPITDLKAN